MNFVQSCNLLHLAEEGLSSLAATDVSERISVGSVDTNTWNKVVTSHNGSKIYHLYQWGTLLEEVHGHELVYLQENDGVFPLAYIKSLIFGNRLISLPFADYGGPCAGDERTTERLVSACEQAGQKLSADFIEVRCPSERYVDIFENHGFETRDDYLTFVLPLDRKIEELWKGIGDKNRNMVRKAEKSGIQIIEATNKADLRAFFLLYQKTMKKLGTPPQPYKFFEKMWDLFYPQNLIIPLARCEARYIAGGLFFLHSRIIHYAYGCSLREHLQLAPHNLIQWHVIKWGHERGFSYLDFGRSREDEGTVLFKKRWGGKLVRMPYFYKFYRKELNKRQEIQYRWISRLWRRYMPEPIANRIGPWVIKQVG